MRDGGRPDRDRAEAPSPPSRLGGLVFGAAVLLCFGVLGLLWLLLASPRRRQRRSAECALCHRRRRAGKVLVAGFAMLLIVGAGVRTQMTATPLTRCNAQLAAGPEEEWTEPPAGASSPEWWATTRATVTAPISGVMLMATRAGGMSHCSGSSVVVAFSPPPRASSGGSVVGDVFVTWIPESDGSGVALPGQDTYLRIGPNSAEDPTQLESLARHESHHVDQWAAATLAGGPLAMPVSYYLDSLLFPSARNHFERAAGLADGGYEPPPDYGPEPLWLPITITGGLVLLVMRRRIRSWSRLIADGRAVGRAQHADRCSLHTTGWFRQGPRRPSPRRAGPGHARRP